MHSAYYQPFKASIIYVPFVACVIEKHENTHPTTFTLLGSRRINCQWASFEGS